MMRPGPAICGDAIEIVLLVANCDDWRNDVTAENGPGEHGE
jgi:hypothetical protein